AARQVEPPGPRVEGGEQPVLDEDAGIGELVQQSRLAGVGVADQRHAVQPGAGPGLALVAAVLAQLPELGLELGHPPQQPPAVDLQLRLPRTAGADATTLLAEGLAAAAEARQPVPQLGQLVLRLALLGPSVLGEDVE